MKVSNPSKYHPKSSILFSDFPLQTNQLLGYPRDYGKPPYMFPKIGTL